MKRLDECLLYGILDLAYCPEEHLARTAESMADGGVDIIQLRAKDHSELDTLRMAKELAPIIQQRGIPFLINDHPHLVAEAGADGAHVGQDDMPVSKARALMPPGSLVGKSTHSLTQALQARDEQPDYIGFGPIHATPTKPDYTPVGFNDIKAVQQVFPGPVFCIGGLNLENLDEAIHHGTLRAVVVSGILTASDITATCRALKDKLVSNFALHLGHRMAARAQ